MQPDEKTPPSDDAKTPAPGVWPETEAGGRHNGHEKGAGKAHSKEIRLSAAEYEKLTSRIKELEEVKEKMLRTAADFENAKKRLLRDREDTLKFGQEKLIRGLLPVLDNLTRALGHADPGGAEAVPEDNKYGGVRAGIEMIFKQLAEVLKNEGLVRVDTAGQAFNPHLHEAVAYVHEEGPEDMIVDEIEPGYLLQGRLLRAAKVRVRIAPAKPDPLPDGKPKP